MGLEPAAAAGDAHAAVEVRAGVARDRGHGGGRVGGRARGHHRRQGAGRGRWQRSRVAHFRRREGRRSDRHRRHEGRCRRGVDARGVELGNLIFIQRHALPNAQVRNGTVEVTPRISCCTNLMHITGQPFERVTFSTKFRSCRFYSAPKKFHRAEITALVIRYVNVALSRERPITIGWDEDCSSGQSETEETKGTKEGSCTSK